MYDCTFDLGKDSYCVWKIDKSADFTFTRRSGKTPSSGTGPSNDHTSGTGFFLNIIYINIYEI